MIVPRMRLVSHKSQLLQPKIRVVLIPNSSKKNGQEADYRFCVRNSYTDRRYCARNTIAMLYCVLQKTGKRSTDKIIVIEAIKMYSAISTLDLFPKNVRSVAYPYFTGTHPVAHPYSP